MVQGAPCVVHFFDLKKQARALVKQSTVAHQVESVVFPRKLIKAFSRDKQKFIWKDTIIMITYHCQEMKFRILSLDLLFLLCLSAAQNLRRQPSRVKGSTLVSRDRQLYVAKKEKIADMSMFEYEPESTNAETSNEDPESFGLGITSESGLFVENENTDFQPEIDPLNTDSERANPEVDPNDTTREKGGYINTPSFENDEPSIEESIYEGPKWFGPEPERVVYPLGNENETVDSESRVDSNGDGESVDSQPYEDPVNVGTGQVEQENGGQKETLPEIDPLDDRSERVDSESRVDPIENISEPENNPVDGNNSESERVDSQPNEDSVDVGTGQVEQENGDHKESVPEIDPLDDRSERVDSESRVDPLENTSKPENNPMNGNNGESERVDSQPYEVPVDAGPVQVEQENEGQNGNKYLPNREKIADLSTFEKEFLNNKNEKFAENSTHDNPEIGNNETNTVTGNSNASSLGDSTDNNVQIYHEEYFPENFDNSTNTSIIIEGKGNNEEDVMDSGTEIVQNSISNSKPEIEKTSDVSSGVGTLMYQRSFLISSTAPLIHFLLGLL